jgi:RNA polymerase sigma-70 factor, ECF subfamily
MFTAAKNEICEPKGQAVFANGPATGDAILVVAAKNGDARAFEILVERYQRRILALAMRFTHIREDAEDIVQQSFQKAFIHLHKFEERSSFSTWLTRIAINEGLMLLRKRRGLREVPIDGSSDSEEPELPMEVPDLAPGPENNYLRHERERILSAAVKKLNRRTREAIELRELSELSTEETARVLGVSIGAVKARVFHGRQKLRKTLRRYVESTRMQRKEVSPTACAAER